SVYGRSGILPLAVSDTCVWIGAGPAMEGRLTGKSGERMATALTAQGNSLSDRELADYRKTGFHIARGLIPPDEVAALAQEAGRLRALEPLICRDNLRCRFQPDIDSGESAFECFDPMVDLSSLFLEYSRDCRILEVMRSLYSGEEPHLCHNQFIYKP